MSHRVHTLDTLEPRTLLAADPITDQHELWAIPYGSAVIDGDASDWAWDSAWTTDRTLAFREARATVGALWDYRGLYLLADVIDQYVWADGSGAGSGNVWDLQDDDSITWYFDPDGSRDEWLQVSDFAFGANLGNAGDPEEGAGVVSRHKFVTGNGAGGAPGVVGASQEPTWAASFDGTVNDDSDLDEGWTIEIFVPWAAMGMASPSHGDTMGINFDLIFDDSGGTRDLNDNRNGAQRFDLPTFVDDHILGAHSAYSATQAGINGPVAYAEAMFIDGRALATPAPIDDLAIASTSAFGARLEFTAPAGTTAGEGHVSAYEIRYASGAITSESDWANSTVFAQTYTPMLAGSGESLRLIGLEPGTAYHVAVRGVDGAGNLGVLSASASFATDTLPSAGYQGRVVPSPTGGSFVFENGDAFVPVGDHLGLSWAYTRNLFPGNIYNRANGQLINFYDNPSYEGVAEPYFELLQQRGVNTMRLYIELLEPGQLENPYWPEGGYWLESTPNTFNDNMRVFLRNLTDLADEYGIYLILSPFDTFHYVDQFSLTPWSTANGGPLTDMDLFFESQATLAMAQRRIDVLGDWVSSLPQNDNVIGWESPSEWDSYGWGLHPSGDGVPGRTPDMRIRAAWMEALQNHMRESDPDRLVFSSTIVRDPRGPTARAVFNSRSFDAYTSHLYTPANLEPINNPDADKSVRGASEQAALTSYWMTHRTTNRPFIDGEWGMSRADWPNEVVSYRDGFTYEDDEALFRAVLWAGLAAGQAGTPLRINTEELAPNSYLLTDPLLPDTTGYSMFNIDGNMRPLQEVLSYFSSVSTIGFDFATAAREPLLGLLRASSAAHVLRAWGSASETQGVAYVLQDANETTGTVTDGVLTIRGLQRDSIFDVEFWSTAVGTTTPLQTITGLFAGDGTLTIDLPSFATDVALKFRARESGGQSQRIVSMGVAGRLVQFAVGVDGQPVARIADNAEGLSWSTVDIAGLANFNGRVVDMTPFTTGGTSAFLAFTDERHHLWLLSGDVFAESWRAQDLTATIDAPGLTGDLTTYQPSWGSLHIAGLDARGHAINYWSAPSLGWEWQHADLTEQFDGPVMAGGLTGYVASWDGLNLAGLNEDGEVIVYWWAPGLDSWRTLNMTESYDGPNLFGQLDAYVTPWGGLNITGLDASGDVTTYWWAPGLDSWNVSNISAAAGASAMAEGVSAAVSSDGFINLFAIDAGGALTMLRWDLGADQWSATDATVAAGGPAAHMPLAAGAAGSWISIGTRTSGAQLAVYEFNIQTDAWTFDPAGVLLG